MKFKKIMFVGILLLAIFAIGAVSASGDADNLAAAGGDDFDIGTPLDDEILSLENTATAVSDGNFTDGGEEPEVNDGDDNFTDFGDSNFTDFGDSNFTDEGDDEDDTGSVDSWLNSDKIYTDSIEDLVSVSVPNNCDGTISIEVNGDEKGSWVIEHYDEVTDSYYGWKLSDLQINDAGDYTITVKLDGEIINSEKITVYEFNYDEFRGVIDYENQLIKFYCPIGSEGTLRVLTYRHYDDGEKQEFNGSYDLADCQEWNEWKLTELGLQYDGVWTEFILNVKNVTGDDVFYYVKGYATTYNGDDDDDPYHIEMADSFNITDRDAEIIKIYCPEGTEGYFVITADDEDGIFLKYSYEIKESDYDNDIQVTALDLNIAEPRVYKVCIFLTDDPENLEGRQIFESYRGLEAIDYTQFRVIEMDTWQPNVLFSDSIFAVYCPDGNGGNITVTVREGDDEEPFFTSLKSISDKDDENQLYWNLSELNMDNKGEYFINIYAGDDELQRGMRVEVVNPIYFEEVSIINSSDKGRLFYVEIPSEISDANITLIINDEEFTYALDDFITGSYDAPYWEYMSGPGWENKNYKQYFIDNYHIDYDFSENTYQMAVNLAIAGRDLITESAEVRLYNRNVVSNENISIEVFANQRYYLDNDWTAVVQINAYAYCDGDILITVAGNDWTFESPLIELDSKNDEGDFQIYPCAFNELGPGDYEITLAYIEDGEKVIETSAFVTFYNDDEGDDRIYPNIWDALDGRGILYLDTGDGDIVHVDVPPYFGGNIIIIVNDTERVNWEIDYENDGDWTYNEWNLNDLGITEAGNYTIEVKHNDETLHESTIYVVEWDENSFRVDINYEDTDVKFLLYYPEGALVNATVRIDKDNEGDMEFIDELFYEITPQNSTGPFVWSARDFGLENDRSYHFYVAVFDGEDLIIDYAKWFYWNNPEIRAGIWNCEDERGTLYTDSEGKVLNVEIPPGFEGNIIVIVNGIDVDTWEIESDDEDGWAYKEWGVEEIGLFEQGNYTIELIYDNGDESQTLINETISVSEFKNETFRAMIQYTTETIRLYVPDGAEGTVSIITEKETEDDDLELINELTHEITSEDYGNWIVWSLHDDLAFEADGAFRIFTLTVTNAAGDVIYPYKISHVDGEKANDPDWYHEEIEFDFIAPDDNGYMEFNKTSDVPVAYLYIPDNDDYADVSATVYVELNGKLIDTIRTDEIDRETLDKKNHYPIVLDLSGLKDKDMLTFTIVAEHADGESAISDEDEEDYVHIIILEDKDTFFIAHDDYDPKRLEYTVFFGNLTTGDTNDPDLMGTNFNGNFVILTISNLLNITEGNITVSDGNNLIFSKQLSECDKEYDYGSVGYSYSIALDEVIDKLPENKDLIVTFKYPDHSLIQKRFRESDYLYKLVLPEDIQDQFHFNVIEDFLSHESDTAISLWTRTNRQSIYIDLGGGYFIVYVNGTKVENLGRISYDTWKEEGSWRDDDWDYVDNWAPDEDGFLARVAKEWGSELELFRLSSWYQGAPEINITLVDLGITEAGTYNIRIVHYPSVPGGLDDHSDLNLSDFAYADEYFSPTYTEFINANITCSFDPDYAGVEILKERIYKNGQPFLITFQFGDNVLSESNRILVYLNGELAFNGTTLFWEESDEGEMELVNLWELNDGQLNEYPLNEYGVLDVGEYEAVVYLVKGDAAPVEIGSGNFTVIKQRGNMSFEMKASSQDDGVHTVLYADIPEGNWDEYCLSINIADSDEIYPNEDDWFSRWYDEYVVYKDNNITLKESLDNIIGKGPVAIDLGVLDEGTHIWVMYWHGEETVFGDWDFYQNDFTVNSTVEEPSEIALSNDITFDYNETGSANVTLVGAKDVIANVIGHDEADITFENGTITVSGLDAGSYTLNVTTVPENGFTAVSTLANITVNKIDANLTVEATAINVGEEESIIIKVLGFDTVTVQFNGINYTIQVVDGVAYLNVTVDVPGTYEVIANVEGNNNINPTHATALFKVSKLTPQIIITPGEAIEGSDLDVTVEIANATGNVVVNTEEFALVNGKASATIKNLTAGNLTVNVVYSGDSKFLNASESINVAVKAKGDTGLTVSAENITVGETATVNVEINANITGKVTVDGNAIDIVNGKGTYTISNLTAGEHTVTVAFAGDKYFNADEKTATFKVTKLTPEIIITPGEAIEGSDLAVEVEIAGATGSITVNDEKIALVDGKASASIKNLTAGNLTVNVVYSGDSKFLNASESINVAVKAKGDAGLTVSAENIEFGQTATVNVEINANVTGKVTVDGNAIDIADGKGTYTISNLTAGEHTVTVAFAGDKYFNADEKTAAITVNKIKSSFDVTGDITFTYKESGSTAVVNLTGAESVEATVVNHTEASVKVDGNTITVSNLDVGTYTLTITTVPAANYYAVSKTVSVEVTPIIPVDPALSIAPISDVEKGSDVTISISAISNFTGSVKVSVDGNEVGVADVVKGAGSFTIGAGNFTVGENTVKVASDAGEYFTAAENATAVIVIVKDLPKAVTKDTFDNYFNKNGIYIADLDEIILTGEFTGIAMTFSKPVSITGQDAVLTNVLVNINSDNVTLSNLKITNNLTDYAISVNSANNVSLIANDLTAFNSIIISNSADFIVDSNTIVSPVGENVCGILINGTGNGAVTNNKLDLKSTKTAYAINTNPTGPLKVSYINNTIDAESYFAVGIYDDSELIKDNKISLSGNYAIGIIILSNANVEDNEITLETSNTGSEEDVHDPIGIETAGIKVNNTATITNNSVNSTAKSISVVGGSSNISDNTLNGHVTVESDGNTISNNVISTTEEYAVDLGTSTGNNIGSNELYSSSGNGNDAVKATEENIIGDNFEKFDPALTISVADVYEGSNAVITITTNATFSGDVSVQIGDSNYTVSITNGTGSAPVSGLATGNYTATAIFRATEVFVESIKNTTFAVKAKVATAINVGAVTTTYATSKNIVITLTDAEGNALDGETVTLVLNGAKKVLTIKDGKVSYAIGTKLLPKTYTATVTFDGDAKYVNSTGSAKVTVKKATPKVTAAKKTFKRTLKTKKYTITLKTNQNKVMKNAKVYIKVNGKTYSAKTNSKGKATFKITKLTKKGKFNAVVTYKGNTYYNKVTKKVQITIK